MTDSSRRLVAISVAFALFTDGAVYTLIVPFLPQLFEKRLATPDVEVERWTSLSLAMYGIASLLSTWVAAYYTDRCRYKSRLFMVGNVVLLASTLFFFLGPAPGYILAARALQGAAGACLYISGLAFLISRIDPPEAIGFYMGYMTLAQTMGELVGPLMGGSLYEHVGHWAVFGVTEGIIAVDMILRLLIREPKKEETKIMKQKGDNNSRYEFISDEEEKQWLHEEDDGSRSSTSSRSRSTAELLHDNDERSLGKAAIQNYAFAIDSDHDDGARAVAILKDIRSNAILSVAFTTVTGIVRCALEATIPLYVFHHFSWDSTLGGAAIFALLSPAIVCPWVGRYTAQYGPRRLSLYAFSAGGVLLVALGLLTLDTTADGSSVWATVRETLFMVDLFAVGLCVAMSTAAHTTTQSTFAQKGDELLTGRFLRRSCDDDYGYDQGEESPSRRRLDGSWGLTWLTSGVLLAGNSTAWALGMFLGPLAADVLGFGSDAEWLRLCLFLAVLSWVAAVGIGVAWRKNTELFPEEKA